MFAFRTGHTATFYPRDTPSGERARAPQTSMAVAEFPFGACPVFVLRPAVARDRDEIGALRDQLVRDHAVRRGRDLRRLWDHRIANGRRFDGGGRLHLRLARRLRRRRVALAVAISIPLTGHGSQFG